MRKALILLDENSSTSGTVINIVETLDTSEVTLKIPEGQILWDCSQYDVQEGDFWDNGFYYRESEKMMPSPTAEQKIIELEYQNSLLSEQITSLELALCELYEASL